MYQQNPCSNQKTLLMESVKLISLKSLLQVCNMDYYYYLVFLKYVSNRPLLNFKDNSKYPRP